MLVFLLLLCVLAVFVWWFLPHRRDGRGEGASGGDPVSSGAHDCDDRLCRWLHRVPKVFTQPHLLPPELESGAASAGEGSGGGRNDGIARSASGDVSDAGVRTADDAGSGVQGSDDDPENAGARGASASGDVGRARSSADDAGSTRRSKAMSGEPRQLHDADSAGPTGEAEPAGVRSERMSGVDRSHRTDETETIERARDANGAEAGEQARRAKEAEAVEQARRAKEAEAGEQARRAKAAEAAEQARRAKEAEAGEQARRTKEAEAAEQARRAKDAEAAEQARRAKDAEAAEQARRAKDAEAAEQARRAKDAEAAEQARRTREAEAAEQARRMKETEAAEQARRAEEVEATERARRAKAAEAAARDRSVAGDEEPADGTSKGETSRGDTRGTDGAASPTSSSSQGEPGARAASSARVQPLFDAPDRRDDLTRISGIGPAMQKLLNGLGVVSFAQLAAFDSADVERVDTALTGFPGRIVRDDWVGQARGFVGSGAGASGMTVADDDGRTASATGSDASATEDRPAPDTGSRRGSGSPSEGEGRGQGGGTGGRASRRDDEGDAPAPGARRPLFDAPANRDDLTRISGIGPVMQRLLNELGVVSFAQLAAFDQADIDRVDAALEDFPGRVERDDWVGQARQRLGSTGGRSDETSPPRNPTRSVAVGTSPAGDGSESPVATSGGDDLTRINGIGRATRERLGKLGVTTFADIAGFDTADIERVEQALDDTPGRIERDGWIAQARAFAND